jgi:RNA polymerase sigma-54 factor
MIFQNQVQSLRPLTTAHLAQTMTLLELTSNELRQNIEAELSSNPALELADQPRCPMCHKATVISGLCPMCSRRSTIDDNQPIIFVSPYTDFTPRDSSSSDEYITDEWSVASEDLPTFVMRQVALELAPEDRQIVAHILTSLDEDGLLRVPLTEFARYFHVPIPKIESLLQLIQHAEPVGVGSQSPQEALLVQIEQYENLWTCSAGAPITN